MRSFRDFSLGTSSSEECGNGKTDEALLLETAYATLLIYASLCISSVWRFHTGLEEGYKLVA